MKQQFWTSVCFGGVVAGLWWVLLPEGDVDAQRQVPESPVKLIEGDRRGVFDELNYAESRREKLKAVSRLQAMDLKEVRREMQECPEDQYRGKLSFAIKVMILRLAELDPRAAVAFIKERWVREDQDNSHMAELFHAWPLVTAEWAHQDPMGMFAFWEETQKTQNHPLRIFKTDLAEMMLAGSPLGFMELYHNTDYFPLHPERFTSTLKSEEDFRAVLNTWKNPTERVKRRWERLEAEALRLYGQIIGQGRSNPKKNRLAQAIIARWRQVDEAGFLASEFVEWEAE